MRNWLPLCLVILVALLGCASPAKIPDSPRFTNSVRMRFQNQVGLNLYSAGCSILNYGGLSRYCEYAAKFPADLSFQIGPAFAKLGSGEPSGMSQEEERKILLRFWQSQRVQFFAVDAADLEADFAFVRKQVAASGVLPISANLYSRSSGRRLFLPYYEAWAGRDRLLFVGLSEPSGPPSEREWEVRSAVDELIHLMESQTVPPKIVYVLGSLSQSLRETMRTKLPGSSLFFIGGPLSEANSVDFVPAGEEAYWLKAPDLGRGLGELFLNYGDRFRDLKSVRLAGIQHQYFPLLLRRQVIATEGCLLEGLAP